MGKEITVRQNRCDEEMNFLLFGCFFFFAAIQILAGGESHARHADTVSSCLLAVFAPGFLLRLGYCYNRLRRANSEQYRKRWLRNAALRYGLYFFALALACELAPNLLAVMRPGGDQILLPALAGILSLSVIRPVCAVFFALVLTSVLVWIFDSQVSVLTRHRGRMILCAVPALLCAFFYSKGETYPITASLFGAAGQAAVPCVPYFAFFLFGAWLEEEKPGFSWKLLLVSGAVTAGSVLLYHTPLQALCRITVSFLPVYVVYFAAEGLSELTLRFQAARCICRMAEPVLYLYLPLLFALGLAAGYPAQLGLKKALLAGLLLAALSYAAYFAVWLAFKGYAAAAERFRRRTKHKTAVYFAVYTAVFAVVLLLAFLPFLWNGKTLLWRLDGVSQYYPRAVYFANYIRELLANFLRGNFELPMYDFRIGMGGEIVYSMEPLYFLFALFGAEKAEFTYTLLILLRFYLAGVTSSAFCLYFRKGYFAAFLASLVYVFCGFSLSLGTWHMMFMIPMILFPLLIIAVEEILRGRRWYLCAILVALAMFSNYYFLYMCTFGMGVYFLVRYFACSRKKSLKDFIGRGLVLSGSYLLGAAMSCIILASNILGAYGGSSRSGSAVINTPSLFYYGKDWLLSCFQIFPVVANSPGMMFKLGFLPIAFFAVVALFLRKGRRELKAISVISLIAIALPLSGFVMGGFSSVMNRWCFMLALPVAYTVADCLPDLCRLSKKEKYICAAAAGIYGFFAFFGGVYEGEYVKTGFLCLCVTFVVLLLAQEGTKLLSRYGRQCLMVLLTFAMIFYSGLSLFQFRHDVEDYADFGRGQELAEDTPLTAASELEDDSFYRVATSELNEDTASASMMHDYNSIYLFYSTLNRNLTEYLEKMGATSYTAVRFMGLDNRAFLNELAAVKYYMNYEDDGSPLPCGYEELLRTQEHGKETIVSENKYALPLGYTYSDSISREELEQYGVLERQEVLMQKVMLEEDAFREDGKTQGEAGVSAQEPTLSLQPVEITSVKEKGIRLSDHELSAEGTGAVKKKYLKLEFESAPASETCLVLKNAAVGGDMPEEAINVTLQFGNDKNKEKRSYRFLPDNDSYATGQKDYVFNLGYHEEPVTSLTIRMNRAGAICFDSLELYSQPMTHLEEYTQALTEDVLEHVEIGTNTVTGDIALDEDKILLLSIPYQNGWTALVDGAPAKLARANYMYMALPLEAGTHTIELEYAIPGVKYALVIMPCAVVLFIILCLVTWLIKRKNRRKSAGEEI